jgi:hypothetical protein
LLPVLDVKRNEVFFSIYQASLAGEDISLFTHKFGENTIFVSKVSGDHLVDSESFADELDRIFLSEPIIVTVGGKPAVFVSGTGFLNYRHLFKDIRKINYNFYLDSKSALPDARYLNMCSNFRATREIKSLGLNAVAGKPAPQTEKSVFKGDKNVVPVYVRDFVPFIKKQDI